MTGHAFSEGARRCVEFAREGAESLHHAQVATEHLLLALLREPESNAAAVLRDLGVDPDALRRHALDRVRPGPSSMPTGPDLPFSGGAKRALELAVWEARDLDHGYVGSDHLLLGLLRVERGVAAEVLRAEGVTLERARDATRRLREASDAHAASATPRPAADVLRAMDPLALVPREAVPLAPPVAHALHAAERAAWQRGQPVAPLHLLRAVLLVALAAPELAAAELAPLGDPSRVEPLCERVERALATGAPGLGGGRPRWQPAARRVVASALLAAAEQARDAVTLGDLLAAIGQDDGDAAALLRDAGLVPPPPEAPR